eukprot:GEZU01000749.1.p1 GENE.GEZU01000749.1~~GEZU01000749.1.p1  ORF type:complete len:214 (-),score=38.97 GEZU01000749.1:122-763(-)
MMLSSLLKRSHNLENEDGQEILSSSLPNDKSGSLIHNLRPRSKSIEKAQSYKFDNASPFAVKPSPCSSSCSSLSSSPSATSYAPKIPINSDITIEYCFSDDEYDDLEHPISFTEWKTALRMVEAEIEWSHFWKQRREAFCEQKENNSRDANNDLEIKLTTKQKIIEVKKMLASLKSQKGMSEGDLELKANLERKLKSLQNKLKQEQTAIAQAS